MIRKVAQSILPAGKHSFINLANFNPSSATPSKINFLKFFIGDYGLETQFIQSKIFKKLL